MSATAVLGRTRAPMARWALVVGVSLIVLTVVSRISGTPDLLSRGSASATLRFAVPITLAGLGGLWAERSGVINIGLEGMMVVGSWFGAWIGYLHGPWWGVGAAVVGGAVFGLLHALMTVTFGIDQAVSGLSINLLAAGAARFLSSVLFVRYPTGSISQSPQLDQIGTVDLPLAEALLGPLATSGLPVVSEGASVLLGLTTGVSWFTVLALGLVGVTYVVLWRTTFGLRLRATGESAAAADSLGVDPNRLRYAALAISGGFAGLGGAFLVTVAASIYREGQVAGRGFIGLATVIFGNWMPGRLFAGSLLFGFTDALRTRQEATVRALLLAGAIALAVLAFSALRRGERRSALVAMVVAVAMLAWYSTTETFPTQFVGFIPHLTTLVVLAVFSQNLRAPAGIGIPYRRTEAT